MIFIHSHSFLPKTLSPIFHFFSFQSPQKHKAKPACRESSRCCVFFSSSTILSHPLSLYGLASLVYLHIVQLFFLVLFWYNFLLFDSFLFFWRWWCCSYCSLKTKLEVLDSLLQGTELLFNFLSFMPSCLPSFPFVWSIFLIYKF